MKRRSTREPAEPAEMGIAPRMIVVPYDPAWPAAFERERERLRAALESLALRIDHHGSTAVPGLAAKPVIDIQISVARLDPFDACARALARLGYVHVPHADDAVCPFFHRPAEWPHTHHVHLVQAGGEEGRRTLAFRDYLCGHSGAARESSSEWEVSRSGRGSIEMSEKPALRSTRSSSPGGASRNAPGAAGSGGGAGTNCATTDAIDVKNGFLSGTSHTASAKRAPGLRTRPTSDAARTGSGQNIRPKRQVAASNDASGKASASASISRTSRLSRSSRCARRRVTSAICGDRSI